MKIDLKQLMMIWQFLALIAPMVGAIYDTCRSMFPDGTPGAIKMDAFKALLQQAVAMRDELKRFEPVWNEAWPMVQTMVEAYHTFEKSVTGPAQEAAPAK